MLNNNPKSIHTLVKDIQELVTRKDGWFSDELARSLSSDIAIRLKDHLGTPASQATRPTLRLSKMGPQCPKALWASVHAPELAESLPPWAEIKFTFGHTLEALAVALSKAAGHLVTGEQDEVTVDGIVGHRDCVIDGCVVDVKSCSPRAFEKLKNGSILQMDSFGYLDQLDGYVVGSYEDPLVTVKDKGYILGIDKVLGHMVIFEHVIRSDSIRKRIAEHKSVVARVDPPECTCGTREEGKSGNIGLDVKASYSAFKHFCFPNLRTFLYASGPTYLTKVVRQPDVTEIDKYGNYVFH